MLTYHLNILREEDLVRELELIDCDPRGIKIMIDKLSSLTIKITDLPGHLGLVLKEEALSCGGECALPRDLIRDARQNCDCILLLNQKQLKIMLQKMKKQAFQQLRLLANELDKFLRKPKYKQPLLVGILNVTPDSFSDGGEFLKQNKALTQAQKMIGAGAKIIDIGGESSRPGAGEISVQEELRRTLPVLKALRKINKKILISIDTTKSAVALAAVKAGADIINDISGLKRDAKIAKIAKAYNAKLILMHRSADSKTMQQKTAYKDVLKEILLALQASTNQALAIGVKKENIIIDPGIGFGKTTAQNLYLIKNLCAFKSLGYAVLLGSSRKSVIGNVLKNQPPERLVGTIATSIMGQLNNVDYLRVHDVRENREAVKMWAALVNG